MVPTAVPEKTLTRGLLDVLIRAGLIAVLAVACYQVFQPFRDLMLWALILAVTFYPLHGKLKGRLGIGDGRAASLIVLVTVALLMVPIYLLGTSIADSVERSLALGKAGDWRVPPPPDSIASWPLIGQRLHGFWQQASGDPTSRLHTVLPYLKDVGPARTLLLGPRTTVEMHRRPVERSTVASCTTDAVRPAAPAGPRERSGRWPRGRPCPASGA